MIPVFIMVIYAFSLYAMDKEPLLNQSSLMNNYGSLTSDTLNNIHEQKKYVLLTPEEEQHDFVFNDLGRRIEGGIKCGAGVCVSMMCTEVALGLCLGYGINFVCWPNVWLSTAVVSGGTCLCTSFFCSEKQPCDICCSA